MTEPREPASMLAEAAASLASELSEYLLRHRSAFRERVQAAGPEAGLEAGRFAARSYDGMLGTLFSVAHAVALRSGTEMPAALAAVGSYGRGAIALHSDIDVRILVRGEPQESDAIAEAILYPLWDMRVSVGHQVVCADALVELARSDLATATTLLDWRPIGGEEALHHQLADRVHTDVFSAAAVHGFVDRLQSDTEARHRRFGATVYLLEPDIKLGAGGLRDLDVVLWCTRARWKVQRIEDLVRVGILVPREVREIVEARAHLWSVRNQLHLLAQRRSDRLTYDSQERIAELLGFGEGVDGAERFMSAHYQHAKRVTHARELILGRAMERPRSHRASSRRVADGLTLFDDNLAFESAAALAANPVLALGIYEEAVRRHKPVHPSSRETMRRALRLPRFRASVLASADARANFLRLCTTVQETRLRGDSVLGDMHDVGLLTTLVPEFEPLVGRVHHDVYHVLTVDVHSVAAVDRLRALARGEGDETDVFERRVAMELARPRVLFLAVLLHDIGKSIGRSAHAVRGAPVAFDIARRLGLREDEATQVAHLVEHHLALYHIATRRDLEDPDVLRDVDAVVRGREGLRELYLLTFVDVSTTSPDAMTSWKAELLRQLFASADAHLGHALLGLGRDEVVRSRVRDLCSELGNDPSVRSFLASMPERYVLATDATRVREHARVAAGRNEIARIAVLPSRGGAAAEVAILADDRPGLLAAMAAALAANRLSVLDAQIYSRQANGTVEAVDLFVVDGPPGWVYEDVQRAAGKVQRDLVDILEDRVIADDLVGPRIRSASGRRPSPHVETEVRVDNRASAQHTIVEAFTRDRPGLLYTLASTFRDLGLSIRIAKINTEGTRVADVFYVCEPDGSKVQTAERADQIRRRLAAALEQSSCEGS